MVLRTSTVSGPIVCLELSPVPAGSVVFVPYSCIIVVQYVLTRSTCCTVLAVSSNNASDANIWLFLDKTDGADRRYLLDRLPPSVRKPNFIQSKRLI